MIKEKYFDKDLYPTVKSNTHPNHKGKLVSRLLPPSCIKNGIMGDLLGQGPYGCPIYCQLSDDGWVYDDGIFYDHSVWTKDEIDVLHDEGRRLQEMENQVSLLQKEIDKIKGQMTKIKGPVTSRIRKKKSKSGNNV